MPGQKGQDVCGRLGAYLFARRGRKVILDICGEVGISSSTWSRLERGRGLPDVPTLVKLHRVYGIEYNELMEWVEEEVDRLQCKRELEKE